MTVDEATQEARMRLLLNDAIGEAARAGSSALSTWGAEAQRAMAVEEAAELVAALQREQRGRCDAAAVRDEIADVLITALQLVQLYGVEECVRVVRHKVTRLNKRVSDALAQRGEL